MVPGSSYNIKERIRKGELFRKVAISLGSLFGVPLLILTVYAAGTFDFYYFNPDSVQSNFSLLAKGFTRFLEGAGFDATFQAFAQKSDFDRKVKEKKPGIVLVPSWYYQQYGESLGLVPLLVSLENGRPDYRKVLLVRKTRPYTLEELEGKTVAMTTMGPKTEELLSNTYFKNLGLDFSAMNIIITPKDADALYALALGQVDAALVGQATLDLVGGANSRLLDITQKVASSSPVPAPLLCVVSGSLDRAEIERLQKVFLEGRSGKGAGGDLPNYMEMLKINGWQKPF
ncbi:MAG: hypothetical protein Kow0089_23870 [Desulfobulbaceae bacterium]